MVFRGAFQGLSHFAHRWLQPRGTRNVDLVPPVEDAALDDFRVTLEKGKGAKLGADLGNVAGNKGGAVIVSVREDGLLALQNARNPSQEMLPGMIIVEANGSRGYWGILEEISKPGTLEMLVQRAPPKADWEAQITNLRKALPVRNSTGSLKLRLNSNHVDPNRINSVPGLADEFICLPNVRAGDCGTTQCSICLDDVDPDENLVQLPCTHAFHGLCVARWLTQGQGRKRTCPLCVRDVCGECKHEECKDEAL